MKLFSGLYDALLYGMAWCGGFLMAAMMAVIFVDVVLRNLGYQSSAHFFTFTEYALLAVPCLGAPWMVREKGHVYVEILLMRLGARARRRLTMLIAAVCVAVCAVLAWYGAGVTINDFVNNEKDVRSLDMPRWVISGFIPLAFGMMALEFLRYLVRGESCLAPVAADAVDKP